MTGYRRCPSLLGDKPAGIEMRHRGWLQFERPCRSRAEPGVDGAADTIDTLRICHHLGLPLPHRARWSFSPTLPSPGLAIYIWWPGLPAAIQWTCRHQAQPLQRMLNPSCHKLYTLSYEVPAAAAEWTTPWLDVVDFVSLLRTRGT